MGSQYIKARPKKKKREKLGLQIVNRSCINSPTHELLIGSSFIKATYQSSLKKLVSPLSVAHDGKMVNAPGITSQYNLLFPLLELSTLNHTLRTSQDKVQVTQQQSTD